jgi:hypothetical protein
MQSLKELLNRVFSIVRRGNIPDDGNEDVLFYDRLYFVRLPTHLLPQSDAKISLDGRKGDPKRLLRFWPCIVYENIDELLSQVSGDDMVRVHNINKQKAPINVVARLIAWKDRPVESPRHLMQPNEDSKRGYDLGTVTLVHLSGDSLEQNIQDECGELVNFYDSQLELENLMDGVIRELQDGSNTLPSDKASKDLYSHAMRFRTAIDMSLNLIAESVGQDPLPLRNDSTPGFHGQNNHTHPAVTPSPRKRSKKSSKSQNETIPPRDQPLDRRTPTDNLVVTFGGEGGGYDENPLGVNHEGEPANSTAGIDPAGGSLSSPQECIPLPSQIPNAPRKRSRTDSDATDSDATVEFIPESTNDTTTTHNETLLCVFNASDNMKGDIEDEQGDILNTSEDMEEEMEEEKFEDTTPSFGTNSESASRTDNSVERQASVSNPATPELNHLPDQIPGTKGDELSELSPVEESEGPVASRLRGSRNKTSQQNNEVQAKVKKVGSRLVWNRDTSGVVNTKNDRTCLLDAIQELLQPCQKAIVYESMLSNMAPEGDTSVESMNKVLKGYGMTLKHVTKIYREMSASLAHPLMQEKDCKLVLMIKLTNSKGQTMGHSVAWDGKVIYDRPKKSVINNTKDRMDQQGSEEVFHKLYPKKHFSHWRITNVYRLVCHKYASITPDVLADISDRLLSTTVTDMNHLIGQYGLVLTNIDKVFRRRPGVHTHLMNERDCRIIIKMKFSNVKKHSIYHYVAWDGLVIHDGGRMIPVDEGIRTTKRGCIQVFSNLALKNNFTLWRIERVYNLEYIKGRLIKREAGHRDECPN